MRWLDSTEQIVAWNSEERVVPYISPVDGRKHRYFLDFVVWVQTPQGVKQWWVEVKPEAETKKPERRKTEKDAAWVDRVQTYLINQAKWEEASKVAKQNDAEFIVLTEKHIFPSQNSLKRYKQPKKAT